VLPYSIKPENPPGAVETDRAFQCRPHPANSGRKDSKVQASTGAAIDTSTPENGKRKPTAKVMAPSHAKLLVSREEAALMLSISVRGVDYLIATKKLSTRRIGTRVLIPMEEVRRFVRSDHPERMAG
jgi:excisionase family DNA binding protein